MSRVLFLPTLACGALLALTACSGGPSATPSAARGDVLVRATGQATGSASASPAVLKDPVDQVLAAVEEG